MLDFSNFNTSNVSRMDYMFYSCQKLTSIKFGTNFTTANVTNMKGMFAICRSLTTLDISNFDTKGVKDMSTMFSDNPKLTKIDLRAATFDAVTTYTNMFYGANSNIKVIVKDAGGETNVPKTWIQNKLGGKGTVYTVTEWQAAGGE